MNPNREFAGRKPGPQQAGLRAPRLIGMLLALLAIGNLVQGVWTSVAPWLDATLVALGGLALVYAFTFRRRPAKGGAGGLLLVISALLIGFAAPSLNPGAAAERIGVLAGAIVPLIVAFLFGLDERAFRTMVRTIVVFGIVVVVFQYVNPDLGALALGRRTPEGINAIGAGRLLGAASVCALAIALEEKAARLKFVFVAFACVFAAAAVAAASRGPLLGLIAGVVVLVAVGRTLRGWQKFALAVVSAFGAALTIQDLARTGSRVASTDDTGRMDLFRAGWDIALEHPFGVGWGNLYNFLPARLISPEQGFQQYPHNLFIEILVNCGFVALMLFAVGFALVIRAGVQGLNRGRGAARLALFALALAGALVSSSVVGNRLLWVSMGLLAAAPPSAVVRRKIWGQTQGSDPDQSAVEWRSARPGR